MLRLVLATFLWATVMALGVWDYYILKFPPCNLPRIYQEVLMPVVMVRAGASTGSGVILSDTYILTAAHVVGNQREAGVYIYEYEYELPVVTIKTATVIITDTYKDLALLRCESGVRRYAWARLAPRNYQPYLFTPVYAVGCSLGLNPRPSEGIISSIGINRWEISAPVLPGNSGGGVFLKETRPNDRGHSAGQAHELIGIVVWVRVYKGQLITSMAGVVPIDQIYEFLDEAGIGQVTTIPDGQGLRCRSVCGIVPINQIYEFLENAPVSNYILGSVRTRTGPGWLIGHTLMFSQGEEEQTKCSPYLRKAARKTPKCNPLGTQHSEGGELTWQR